MRTSKMTRVMRLAAGTVLAAAVGPVLAQDAPKPMEGGAIAPAEYPTARSIFDADAAKPPMSPVDSLPPPRAAGGSPTPPSPGTANDSPAKGAAAGPAQPLSWWQRCKARLSACLGNESEFEPVPLGASVYATYRNHIANGTAARMVLCHYDFVDGTAALNTHGQDHVAKIAAVLAHNGFPVIIERTPANPALAEARRLTVLNLLGQGGVAIPPDRVVIGPPIANGLRGGEAEIIYQNLLTQTQQRGLVTGAASGFVGAATTPPGAGAGTGGGTGAPPQPR